ncbi:MAG: hypothetical protein Q8M09_17525 [Pseudomonadota bacterium]|nr:hypothetical protein [Pseudomonadota bacterium]MDP1906019.1 hypothetical protein [Pseudomonadota bacterium]MDP2352490.1 hypothetical protein [Pseudomonadota bacterium]
MKAFPSLFATAACLATFTSAQAADDWGGADKAQHFAVSAVLGTASAMHFEDKWVAFGVAMIPGVLKEITDSRFSGKDLAADALGAALGVQLGHWIVTTRGVGYRAAF